jgi:hypothetical protein
MIGLYHNAWLPITSLFIIVQSWNQPKCPSAGDWMIYDTFRQFSYSSLKNPTHIYNPAVGSLMQEDHKYKTSLGYLARPCLSKTKTNSESMKQIKKGMSCQAVNR